MGQATSHNTQLQRLPKRYNQANKLLFGTSDSGISSHDITCKKMKSR